MGGQISPVNGEVALIGDISNEELKNRMNRWLFDAGWTLKQVAKQTGEDYKQVQRWMRGGTTIPATFLAKFMAVVPAPAGSLNRSRRTGEPEELTLGEREELERLRVQAVERESRMEQLSDLMDQLREVLLTPVDRDASASIIPAQATSPEPIPIPLTPADEPRSTTDRKIAEAEDVLAENRERGQAAEGNPDRADETDSRTSKG